ncbi:MFS transporter [Phytomonospora sp. NPDC050363]|uniref:MFS transporter n=1 Tax=Phytomonospora sp. NPDC050363 TaxID=3155642 RepID=UPI0033C87526
MNTNPSAHAAPPSAGRRYAILAILSLATLLLAIDMTVLHLAVPSLVEDVEPSATQLLWIADIYGFALGGLLITMGNLGDRIGRKKLLLSGAVAFGLASAVTAFADEPGLLIAARALLGVAGATIMPSAAAILRNVFTERKERSTAIGIWSAMSASGFAFGPVVGGVLLENYWWGSVFLINLPIMLIVIVAGVVLIPESRNPHAGRIDLLSVVLSFVGIIGLIYGIKEIAHNGIESLDALAGLAVGLVAMGWFVRRQTRLAEPMMDLKLFRSRVFSGAVATNVVTVFGMIALSLVLAQYLQLVLGWSPLVAGIAGIPGGLSAGLTAPFAARIATAWGRGKTVALGLGLLAVSLVLYVRIDLDPNYLTLLPAMVIGGAGMGLGFAITNDIVLSSVPKERSGAAVSIVETATEMGGALGIAVLGSVMNAAYADNLEVPAGVPAEAAVPIREQIGTAFAVAEQLPGELGEAVRHAAKVAFVDGAHVTTLTSAAIVAVFALVAAVSLRGKFVTVEEEDEEVPVPVPAR